VFASGCEIRSQTYAAHSGAVERRSQPTWIWAVVDAGERSVMPNEHSAAGMANGNRRLRRQETEAL
jgi:hypothetical protein